MNKKLIIERWMGVELHSMPSEETNKIVNDCVPIWGRKSDSWNPDSDEYYIILRQNECRKRIKKYVKSDVVIPYTSRFALKLNKGNYDRNEMERNMILIVDKTCPICGMSESIWWKTEPKFHQLFSNSDMLTTCRNCGTGGLVDENDI